MVPDRMFTSAQPASAGEIDQTVSEALDTAQCVVGGLRAVIGFLASPSIERGDFDASDLADLLRSVQAKAEHVEQLVHRMPWKK